MKRAVYIVSDLHIGADPDLDDFSSDQQFHEFLIRIDTDLPNTPVTLVLLGDTFDFWQIVPPKISKPSMPSRSTLTCLPGGSATSSRKRPAGIPSCSTA